MSSPLDSAVEGANGGIQPGRYYGRGVPYLPIDGYPGKLIAIEGTDGVGRSTQIQLLREWLEVKGYGVVETGWTRSPLMQPTIELASNTLNKLTSSCCMPPISPIAWRRKSSRPRLACRALRSLHLHGAGARGCPRHRSAVARNLHAAIAPHGLLPEGRRRNVDQPGPRRAGWTSVNPDGPESGDDIYDSFRGTRTSCARTSMADEFTRTSTRATGQPTSWRQVAAFLELTT
jgi:hypothetical protein